MQSQIADVRDYLTLEKAVTEFSPEVVFHLAAQPLVRDSYELPRETYEINVMGTVNVLEAVRRCPAIRSVVVVTTDKCYENREWHWGYRETDRLGGNDPYSSSKTAAELVVSAYRLSFFHPRNYGKSHHIAVATARAGNVIGGGDWAKDRLVPDLIRGAQARTTIHIRSPNSVRPWQHVLEPICGYLILAERLYTSIEYAEAWNFGPQDTDCTTVRELAERFAARLGGLGLKYGKSSGLHEAGALRLDISKTVARLNWAPRWNLSNAIEKTLELYEFLMTRKSAAAFVHRQLRNYIKQLNS
jgi:CDP-glucose 4,6-dehydratase